MAVSRQQQNRLIPSGHILEREHNVNIGDWFNSAVNLVIGILLGWAAYKLIGLMTTAFWPVAILIPVLFLGVLLLDRGMDVVFERFFPSGVKPARNPPPKPVGRRLSLPLGLSIGLVVAWLGFGLPFLGAT